MALTIILSVGVAATPVFSRLNAGREFTNSYEILYTVESSSEKDADENGVNKVAEEFRTRLDNFAVEDYSVKVQEDQTSERGNKDKKYAIEVSFAADDSEFEFITKYLSFSGGDFSLIGQNSETIAEKVFENSVARIEKVEDTVPYVIIPISSKEKVEEFVDAIEKSQNSSSDDGDNPINKRLYAEGDEGEEEKVTPDIYLVSDWDDADSYEQASKDPHVAEKILMEFSHKNIWYEKAKEEHTEIQYLCGTADEEGNYDLSNLKYANLRARYLMNMFNASSYELSITNVYVNETASKINYNYNLIPATNENLLTLGNDVNIALSTTLISTLIALAIVSLLLVVFYRLSAIAVIANTVGTVFLTFVVFIFMSALLNIPALIGGALVLIASLFTSVFYLFKFKEEVLKGRSLRKANQEASKKSNMITIDTSVLMAFLGLMLYVLAGAAFKPMGVVLFFGALFILAMNLIVFKIMMYLLTNTTAFQNKYNLFAIEAKDVPNVLEDKKTESKGAYENVNFTKRSKLIGLLMSLLLVAAVTGITVFGVLKGSPINVDKATNDYSVVYVEIHSDDKIITDEDSFKSYVLKYIKVNDKALSYDDKQGVEYQKVTKFDSEKLQEEAEPYHYFSVDLNGVLTLNKVEYSLDKGETYVETADGLEDAIQQIVMNVENIELSDRISVSLLKSHETVTNINQGFVALATSLSILGAGIYFALRFRLSRGIAAVVVSSGAATIGYGFLALIRVGTTGVAAVIMPVVALTTLLFALLFSAKEKELVQENKLDLDLAKRKELMVKAISLAASGIIVIAILAIYILINYFGFGLASTAYMFAGMLVGVVVGLISVLTLMGPLAHGLDKLFSKIRLPKFTKKEKKPRIKLHEQPKTSEPEERIFIGIND